MFKKTAQLARDGFPYLGTSLLKLLGYFATGRGSMASRHHHSCGYSYKLDAIRGLDLEPMVLIQTGGFFR